jgi:site-specific DNA recombinase
MRARDYAEAKGWVVVEVYDLAGVSGRSVMAHAEAKRMMEDIRRGHITALIFSKLARLARNTKELLEFSDFFREHNADLVSLQESMDTSTPSGRLFYTIIAAMAQWEREEITDRVRSAMTARAKMGMPMSGRVPYGFQIKDGKIVQHPEEAAIRKLAYDLYLEHRRKKTVATMLNKRGFRARRAPFTAPTVGRMLTDPTGKGEYRSNYTRNVGGKKCVLKPEHDWVVTKVEPIVSNDVWERANALIEGVRTTWEARPGPKPVHPFAGLVFCVCGQKMYVVSNSPKYICKACRTKIPVVDLENLFREELKGYLVNPEHVSDYLSQNQKASEAKYDLLASLKNDHTRVKTEIESTFRLYHAGGLTVEKFKARFDPLEQRREEIETEMPKLEGEIKHLRIEGISAESIASQATDFHARWPEMTRDEKRFHVENLVKSIVISKEEVTINVAYLPSVEMMATGERNGQGTFTRY